jgi:site-specific DNA-methyltransferase (adenine-specific)
LYSSIKRNSFGFYRYDICRSSLFSVKRIFFTCHSGKRVSVNKGDWDLGRGALKNLEFHIEWLKACKRVLKSDGTIWISGTYHSIYQCGVALEINEYHCLNDIVWCKANAAPNLSCRFFTASHETLIWARRER